MRRILLLLLLVALPDTGRAGAKVPPQPPGVYVGEERGVRHLDAVLPGRLVSYAAPSTGGEGRRLYFLVARNPAPPEDDAQDGEEPEAAPDEDRLPPCPSEPATAEALSLILLDEPDRTLVTVRDDLPADATALQALDLDGDGEDELVLARDGELLQIGPGGLEPLWQDASLRWRSLHPRSTEQPILGSRPRILLPRIGELQVLGPDPAAGAWTVVGRVDLPREAKLGGSGVELSSPVPEVIGFRADGTLLLATPPEAFGSRRLRTRVLELSPSGETTATECWARFPGPEEMQEHAFLLLDDRPVLFVTTRPSDRLSLLGEKGIRLFPLEADRSRFGIEPRLAVESNVNLWQDATAMLRDVNGDGAADLVVGYWKGILEGRIVLDAYLREDGGGFATSARATGFDVEEADRSFFEYGPDLDGDGLADLVVRTGFYMLVYPGLPSSNGKKLVDGHARVVPEGGLEPAAGRERTADRAPWWEMSFGARPRFLDLDGDGTSEILLVSPGDASQPGRFRVIRLGPEEGKRR